MNDPNMTFLDLNSTIAEFSLAFPDGNLDEDFSEAVDALLLLVTSTLQPIVPLALRGWANLHGRTVINGILAKAKKNATCPPNAEQQIVPLHASIVAGTLLAVLGASIYAAACTSRGGAGGNKDDDVLLMFETETSRHGGGPGSGGGPDINDLFATPMLTKATSPSMLQDPRIPLSYKISSVSLLIVSAIVFAVGEIGWTDPKGAPVILSLGTHPNGTGQSTFKKRDQPTGI